MTNRRSSGDIVRLAEYQVDRPTVDYPADTGEHDALPRAMPTKIGRYTVLDLLGVGGMGVVCTAYDPKLDRKVALKLLRRKKNDNDARTSTGQARLIREAQSLAKLSHPNIVTVHDVDTYEGRIYMAMEYVDGQSLDHWMAASSHGWRKVVEVFIEAARGLAAAHEAEIIHRDFKPANVLIGKDGRVLVVDFGLAKSRDQDEKRESSDSLPLSQDLVERGSLMDVIGSTVDTKLTQAGRTVGTPAYMAPEQFLGLAVGPQTDQFSFGVALFEALYGYLPFPDDSRDELIDRITEGKVTDPPRDTLVPGWVHKVVLRTLQPRPENRYPNVDALIDALQADPAKRRRRILMSAGGVLLAGLATYGVVAGISSDRALCSGAEDRVLEIWNPDRKAAIKAAFDATQRPYAADAWSRVEEELDARAADWAQTHTAVCEATNVRKDQSTGLMDIRMACLDRRHGEMKALIDVLSEPDDQVVQESIAAVQSLEGAEGCRTMLDRGQGWEIEGEAALAIAEQIEDYLARSKALDNAGRSEAALAQASEALALARELGHESLLARAALQHGRVSMAQSLDAEQIRADLVEAVTLAALTEQTVLEVDAWSQLIIHDGSQGRSGSLDRALALRLPAEMALQRVDDERVKAAYDQALGAVYARNGEPEEARDAMVRALEGFRRTLGPHHTKVAIALSNLGGQFGQMGSYQEARLYLSQAAKTVEEIYGPHHPLLGSTRINLGAVWKRLGDNDQARAEFERAVEILSASMPPGHPRLLKAKVGVAQILQLDDPTAAAQRYEEILTILRSQKETDRDMLATTYNSLGNLQRQHAITLAEAEAKAKPEELTELRAKASVNLSKALETFQAISGEGNTRVRELVVVRLNLCKLEVDRDNPSAAIGHCRQAWELQRDAGKIDGRGVEAVQDIVALQIGQGRPEAATETLHEAVADTPVEESLPLRIALADRLWADPEARAEAVELVSAARSAFEGSPDSEERTEIDRWLRQHQ